MDQAASIMSWTRQLYGTQAAVWRYVAYESTSQLARHVGPTSLHAPAPLLCCP